MTPMVLLHSGAWPDAYALWAQSTEAPSVIAFRSVPAPETTPTACLHNNGYMAQAYRHPQPPLRCRECIRSHSPAQTVQQCLCPGKDIVVHVVSRTTFTDPSSDVAAQTFNWLRFAVPSTPTLPEK